MTRVEILSKCLTDLAYVKTELLALDPEEYEDEIEALAHIQYTLAKEVRQHQH